MNVLDPHDRSHQDSRRNRRPDRDDRLRLDRPGHAAADRAPFRLRPEPRSSSSIPRTRDRSCSTSAASASSSRRVTQDNYRELLTPLLTAGGGQGFCVNLSVDTSSLDIMELCREIGALYIDTVVEPWPGFYFDAEGRRRARTNYALRETMLDARRRKPGGATAVSCCGANPGMVSWFVKQALLNLAARPRRRRPTSRRRREDWARADAARSASRASTSPSATPSAPATPKPMRRVRQHLVGRGLRLGGHAAGRARLGHAREVDAGRTAARTRPAASAAIYLMQPGANTRVRSWTPTAQAQYGFLVTHNESISIADYFTRARAAARSSTGRPATTPITRATTRCCRCTRCSARPASAQPSAPHPRRERDRRRHRRARRAALRPRQERLLVRLAALDRGDARARALPERDRPAGDVARCSPAWSGRWRTRRPASSRPTRWTSAAASRCRRPISAR